MWHPDCLCNQAEIKNVNIARSIVMSVRTSIVGALGALLVVSFASAAEPPAQHFIKESIEGNLAEVKVGGLAQEKGVNSGVKDFGATLAKDHAAANDKAQQIARTLGVTPPREPDAKQKAVYQELAALSGSQFDQHFIQSMVKDHKEDIAKYEKQANSGSGPAADYAKATLPDLRKHLEMAERLRQEQRAASASAVSRMK
jgi:putative membrane protein